MLDASARANAEFLGGRLFEADRDGRSLRAADLQAPADCNAAFVAQSAFMRARDVTSRSWKVAVAPSGQPVVGALDPFLAMADAPAHLPWRAGMRIEIELAVILAHDLPIRSSSYGRAEIEAAVARVHLGLEAVASRIQEGGKGPFTLFLADRLGNAGYVLGDSLPRRCLAPGADLFLTLRAGDRLLFEGVGQHAAGDPLLWLAALASSPSRPPDLLTAGTVLTTGALCGAIDLKEAGAVAATLATGGRVAAVFA